MTARNVPHVSRKRSAAGQRLTRALVALVDANTPPPCRVYGDTGEWLSEDPELRALAVAWCRPCPITAECAEAATEQRERFGVWGGRDRTAIPRRKRTAAAVLTESDAA